MKRLGIVAVLVLLMLPATTSATVHSGVITLPEPQTPTTIGPEAAVPIIDRGEYDHTITVAYDDQTGSLTLTVEVFDPGHWGELLEVGWLSVGATCSSQHSDGTLEGSFQGKERGNGVVLGQLGASAKVIGDQGQVTATSIYNGQAFVFTWQDPAFVSLDWQCVMIPGPVETQFSLNGWSTEQSASEPPTPSPRKTPRLHAKRASATLLRILTKTANAHHTEGFDIRKHYLTNGGVTNNGWASAEPRAKRHYEEGNGGWIIFHFIKGRWRVVTYGSSPCDSGCAVPAAVLRALGI